ncbi:ABC transporter ATP-binding protein [Neoroseomonas soli]|uniref:ABC transporter ATP-binding protein n=1 Tax=Neoroseomonas soli TaxID=1081025 RepID=A0A9X9WUJ4_9PROT|nr:ABC transporter ATP-binding protein [Neoroseomonas soli]MBR0670823.1 ABC transporter ATP-binding protein [Neoroseomonas soli]
MLRLENLRAGYGPVTVLQDVSLEVNAGEVVTIVGGNGAGKTTTLRAICGLIKPTGGRITVDGKDTARLSPPGIVDLGITMVPEGRQLFPFMTVRENLMLGAYKPAARARIEERMEEVLTLFPRVRERLTQLAGSLSGGEQQMVAIARGMMANPKLLMFDEPSLGLAPLIVKQVFGIVDRVVASGTTVLIVEQNIVHTLQIATRGYVLENGKVVMSDTGPALLKDPHVKRAYLGV